MIGKPVLVWTKGRLSLDRGGTIIEGRGVHLFFSAVENIKDERCWDYCSGLAIQCFGPGEVVEDIMCVPGSESGSLILIFEGCGPYDAAGNENLSVDHHRVVPFSCS